jgi:tRNA threonylcarbamoyladenosine biosynthesis protein TsaB
MLIVSLDTSSSSGSAAVIRDGRVVREQCGDGARTHGERLPTELMRLLDATGVDLKEVEQFAVVTGPGSFTGLRVGIATIQGLAFAAGKLVVPVSAFEALAATVPASALAVATWIDAHRGEVFARLVGADHRDLLHSPTSRPPRATLERWREEPGGLPAAVFVGDGAVKYRDVIDAFAAPGSSVIETIPPLAGVAGLIASANRSRAVHPHALVPLYVRRPDAELARDRREYD